MEAPLTGKLHFLLLFRSASFKPPFCVREEWASKHGLDVFSSKRYQEALDIVTARIGVSDKGVLHNAANQILLEGCEKYNSIPVICLVD